MHESDLPVQYRPRPKRPWWRSRLFLGAVLIVLLLVSGFVGRFLYQSDAAARELQQAIAELDEKEPDGWRLHEIEARRAVVPDKQNSALVVLAVQKRLPKFWPPRPSDGLGMEALAPLPFDQRFGRLPAEVQLDETLTGELREDLERVFVALAEAQLLADRPAGRFPFDLSQGCFGRLSDSESAETVANLLRCEAALWSQDGHPDRAIRAARGALNCARSVGDEPTLRSMWRRMAIQRLALRGLERVLAQGEPSAAELAAFQRLLEDEAAQPLLLVAVRAERAGVHETLNDLAAGRLSAAQLGGPFFQARRLEGAFVALGARRANARLLHLQTESVELARLPVEEQTNRLKPLPLPSSERTVEEALLKLLTPKLDRIAEEYHHLQAKLRCGVTAVAAERYRLAHGRWPASLDELVKANVLDAAPVDPFDRAPLRLRRTAEGVAVYSVGRDGADDDGNLSDDSRVVGTNLGFRLWDADRRRGPAHEWIPAPRFAEDPS